MEILSVGVDVDVDVGVGVKVHIGVDIDVHYYIQLCVLNKLLDYDLYHIYLYIECNCKDESHLCLKLLNQIKNNIYIKRKVKYSVLFAICRRKKSYNSYNYL